MICRDKREGRKERWKDVEERSAESREIRIKEERTSWEWDTKRKYVHIKKIKKNDIVST